MDSIAWKEKYYTTIELQETEKTKADTIPATFRIVSPVHTLVMS